MQITRFAVHQTSKVVAICYFCVTIVFVPFFIFGALQGTGPLRWIFLGAPIFYGVMSYLFTAFGCVVYNFIARKVGGIEFSVHSADAIATPVEAPQLTDRID